MNTIRCQVCHQKFKPERSDALTCSSRCRQKAYRRRLSVTENGCKNVTLTVYYGTNASLIKACSDLYVSDGAKVADVTYGSGLFWRKTNTKRFTLLKSDLMPRDPSVTAMDFRAMTYADDSLDVVVLDPPYIHMEGHFRKFLEFQHLYANSETTPGMSHQDIIDLYEGGMREARRVLKTGGTLWVKCKNEVAGNRQCWSHHELYNIAATLGFYKQDEFILVANQPPYSKHWTGEQHHARKAHSFLSVFKKNGSGALRQLTNPLAS